AVQVFHSANEEHLERGHQRRRSGMVENLLQIDFAQVHVEEAQFPHFGGHQMLQDGIAAALPKERLIADENVARSQLAGLYVGHEAVRCSEAAHLVGLQNVADQV